MTLTTALSASLLCLCLCVAQQDPPAFACNPKAVAAADRPRLRDLSQRVRAAMQRRAEAANGYVYTLNEKGVTLPEVAEWIALERLCCPFLTFQLSASGGQTDWVLALTGPDGVKPLLNVEFAPR